MASPAEVRSGQVLAGRYRLGEVLGSGGCATVYAASDTHLDRDVAVKVWHDSREALDESRLTARLHHPGVVVVHDAGTDGDVCFLVMERVYGVSLATEIGLGPLSEQRARDVVGQLARALSLIHADGIVHGDIKPGNVLLGPHNQVTLTDFGVACPTRTRHRDIAFGTPHYLSPEQVRGLPLTPATDIYALGLVLLECLIATRAFPGSAKASAVARLEGGPVVPTTVPAAMARLVQDMTALEPAHRPSAGHVCARLESGTTRAHTVPLTTGTRTQPQSTRVGSWGTLVGAALVAVMVGLAVSGPEWAAGGRPTPDPSHAPTPTVTHTRAPVPRVAGVHARTGHGHGRDRGHGKGDSEGD